ncbi:MAG: hypothetical protein R6U95_04775, partial [Bacteroidales bacterium]
MSITKRKVSRLQRVLVFMVFFVVPTITVFSQTCTNNVGGTDFSPTAGHEMDYYYHLNYVQQTGPSGNFITTPASLPAETEDFAGDNFVYAVTSNPNKLREDFIDIDDAMYVVKLSTESNSELLSYNLSGIEPGSDYTVNVKLYHLPVVGSDCYSANEYVETKVRMAVNPDEYGGGFEDYTFGSGPGSYGSAFDFTIEGTLEPNENSIHIQINTGYNFGECSAIGISDIEVIGCLNPRVKSSKGNEVCTGDQVLLTLDRDYYADSYAWEQSFDDGATWEEFSTSESVVVEMTQPAIFRTSVDGTYTEEYAINTITCCVDEQGNSSSREVVFYDDFGHFIDEDNYVDAFGNELSGLTAPFRAPVGYQIPNHAYQETGAVNDGWYAVSAYMDDYVADYLGKIPEDHSRERNGGYLLINVATDYKGVIYDRKIDGLCEGKELYFDAFVGNASDALPPVIQLTIKSPDGNTILAQSAQRTISPGSGWNRIKVDPFVLEGYTSVRIEIDSQGEGWTGGNDLVLDDIKIMACSPPRVDLFSDIPSLTKDAEACEDTLDMGIAVSDLLLSFYDNDPRYLYQWTLTPDDVASWQNIGGPQSIAEFEIPDPSTSLYFEDLVNGEKTYFRVIAAMETTFATYNNFQNGTYADPDDLCKNYSISEVIEITLNCPSCVTPRKFNITTDDADSVLCAGQSTLLSPDTVQANTDDFDFTWYKDSLETTDVVQATEANVNTSTYTVDFSEPGNYILLVRDKNMPSAQNCWMRDTIQIDSASTPTYTLSGGGVFCEEESIDSIEVTFAEGTAPYTISWDLDGTTQGELTAEDTIRLDS